MAILSWISRFGAVLLLGLSAAAQTGSDSQNPQSLGPQGPPPVQSTNPQPDLLIKTELF